jgi:site-specific DNA-methyltransferase (adenine-specific)
VSGWALHLGDCLDPVTGLASLADGSVDHVICDPPYSEHVHACVRRVGKGWSGPSGGSPLAVEMPLGFDSIKPEQIAAVSDRFARLVRRWVAVFCDAESCHLWREALETAGLDYVRMGAWIKLAGAPQFTGDRPAVGFECIVLAHQPGRKHWNGGGKAGLWSCPVAQTRGAGEVRIHTTQKPIGLMEALVRDFTDPGDLICDPFAGSGMTLVAAVHLGRRAIGWERDPAYHAAATQRLASTREQGRLFDEVPA